MTKRRRAIAFLLTMVLAHESCAKETISRLQWASEVFEQKEERLVLYCTDKYPEQEKSLAADYNVFASRLKAAVRDISDLTKITDRTIARVTSRGSCARPMQLLLRNCGKHWNKVLLLKKCEIPAPRAKISP